MDAIRKHIDLQYSTLIAKEEKELEVENKSSAQTPGDNRIAIVYNPMANYSASHWEKTKLTMKSTWVDYCKWRDRLTEHFKHVQQIDETAFYQMLHRLRDAMDDYWINYIELQVKACDLKNRMMWKH